MILTSDNEDEPEERDKAFLSIACRMPVLHPIFNVNAFMLTIGYMRMISGEKTKIHLKNFPSHLTIIFVSWTLRYAILSANKSS